MKDITASLVNMYHVCKREMWLHAHQINLEQTSDTVAEGKLIGETTYPQRPAKYTEVELSVPLGEGLGMGRGKIDFFDANERMVHEIKKSDKLEHAHVAQVKFYLYLLELNGLPGCAGRLEYPKLRQTLDVPALTPDDRAEIGTWLVDIGTILGQDRCPPLVKKRYCKSCSYHDFCYVGE